MPNHLHLLILTSRPETSQRALATELRAWTRKFNPGKRLWSPIPAPERIPDELHLKRLIRYVHLNPCRWNLVPDPLEWEWSTHRDVTGCTVETWPDLDFLCRLFGTSRARLPQMIHTYISSDPSVAVGGTPPVYTPQPGEPIVADLGRVIRAVSMANRKPLELCRGKVRDQAVHLADQLRLLPDPAAFKMSRASWNRALTRPCSPEALQAALRILADRRLLTPPKSQRG